MYSQLCGLGAIWAGAATQEPNLRSPISLLKWGSYFRSSHNFGIEAWDGTLKLEDNDTKWIDVRKLAPESRRPGIKDMLVPCVIRGQVAPPAGCHLSFFVYQSRQDILTSAHTRKIDRKMALSPLNPSLDSSRQLEEVARQLAVEVHIYPDNFHTKECRTPPNKIRRYISTTPVRGRSGAKEFGINIPISGWISRASPYRCFVWALHSPTSLITRLQGLFLNIIGGAKRAQFSRLTAQTRWLCMHV
ncbi:hypothetical protein B0H13DRAFT_1878996 [Mycena leptocephala]|nr:hypothetical protein B0H13DRAFT_1878996 [Mycena leptocephala]